MFTLPPWPPKNYVLKNVPRNQRSSSELTPIALPRITQSNFAKFLYPIEYSDSDKVEPEIENIHRKIIEIWGERARAWWVDRPGKNAYFLHQLYKDCKFNDGVDNNPIFQHKEKVFNRSFSNESDCIEFQRIRKLYQKAESEHNEKCIYYSKIEQDKLLRKQEKESMKVVPCKFPQPFWWECKPTETRNYEPIILDDTIIEGKSGQQKSWQMIPNFFRRTSDPCVRKEELLKVGLPFRNEGCNWYYKNYPPPNLKFRPKKFST